MANQVSFTDMEYSGRKRKTKREEFLEMMDEIIPWNEWVKIVEPYSPASGRRGCQPKAIETMLRMLLLQSWFNLSDEGVEDTIYDSYAMKHFMGIDFVKEQVPDATTLCRFRKRLTENGIQQKIFESIYHFMDEHGKIMHGGTIVDATIIEAPDSRKNAKHERDPEMHSVKKNTKWYFGMRVGIGVDAGTGYVHHITGYPANKAEVKSSPDLLREDDEVVYGDVAYLGMGQYVQDGVERDYRICRNMGVYQRFRKGELSYNLEKQMVELPKKRVRQKVEYVFHIVKDIFHWRKARYKGIQKNTAFANILFASANLYMCAKAGGLA
jgi:transposase, IS5 family